MYPRFVVVTYVRVHSRWPGGRAEDAFRKGKAVRSEDRHVDGRRVGRVEGPRPEMVALATEKNSGRCDEDREQRMNFEYRTRNAEGRSRILPSYFSIP